MAAHEMKIDSFTDDGVRIVDQSGAQHIVPLPGMNMYYDEADLSGHNTFESGTRLRRHVHKSKDGTTLVAENISIYNHPILLEVNGTLSIVEPGTSVRIGAGVPHSWGIMELGTRLPNGDVCKGTPLMTFRYDEPVEGFTLCRETGTFTEAGAVPARDWNDAAKEEISFPKLSQAEILQLPYIRKGQLQRWDGKPHTIPDDERLPIFRAGKILKAEEFETAIIGFGNVGPTIALSYALKGLNVRVHDIRPEAYDEGMRSIDGALKVLVENRQVMQEEADGARARITNMEQLTQEGLQGTKFIVEAIDEVLQPKQALFKTLSEIAPKDAVLASNTSSLDQDKIVSSVPAEKRNRCIGVHVTLPAYFSPAVEVVKGCDTDAATMQTVEKLIAHLDRKPLHISARADGTLPPGLFWNRLQAKVILECLNAIDNGSVSPEEVHLALTGALAVRWPVVPILDTIRSAGLTVTGQYVGEVANDSHTPQPERDRQMALVEKYLRPGSPLFADLQAQPFERKLQMREQRDRKLLEVMKAQQGARAIDLAFSTSALPDANALQQHAPAQRVAQ